jgi:hypothetical protein
MGDASQPRTPVYCDLDDCIYHERDEKRQVFCHHPDKPMHMRVNPCPLYRLDWKKRRGKALP